ncbi:hypothetical protein COX00_03375 [Candidatus Uhrbacteria bacterium CG22_combo_CG10-13_8_21_14_all_47_17]|uniref:Peptidase C39-like domain-containing protein n=1 Tax=Candidatus Uhrbacteria bacterium CG22_combo_CG10-13_8_21_14_all_47_17 TaxID=1975041 RepID=A0A2H0BSB9_9BACT|nr:MAG: hypothetical protein COX00_03375 [Candidatus Uhrbacteria bacterium CG22_combo_CG10-13_8_21_14_all_47_17]
MKKIYVLLLGACLSSLPFFFAIPSKAAALNERLSGRILLSVEEHGEAWYIAPVTKSRSYLGHAETALHFLQSKALGIKNAQLFEIPTESEVLQENTALRQRLSGAVLLQVESHGEAWYVNPTDLKRYPLKTAEDALFIIKTFGLGISLSNLSSIPIEQTIAGAVSLLYPPFVAQAPLGDWSDPRQADGCEEASTLMAIAWARGEALSPQTALNKIIEMSDWEESVYGYFRDTSVQDTANRLLHQYEHFDTYSIENNANAERIKQVLAQGNVVITAINGTLLGNPYYRGSGPLRHMILIIGYDAAQDEFILHDPGTQFGGSMWFPVSRVENALQDYYSGDQVPVGPPRTAMIVISKPT